jgi:hypothetical protein
MEHSNVYCGPFDVIILILRVRQESVPPAAIPIGFLSFAHVVIIGGLSDDSIIIICNSVPVRCHKEKLGQVDVPRSEEEALDIVNVIRLVIAMNGSCETRLEPATLLPLQTQNDYSDQNRCSSPSLSLRCHRTLLTAGSNRRLKDRISQSACWNCDSR